MSIKTSEKKLAKALQTVYYVLASEREQRKQPLRERADGQKNGQKANSLEDKKC